MPNPGTEMPACPRRLNAPWFSTPCEAASCCVASLYVGGGAGANSSGYSVWRGGSLGGRLGFGLADGGGGGVAAALGREAGSAGAGRELADAAELPL